MQLYYAIAGATQLGTDELSHVTMLVTKSQSLVHDLFFV